MKLEKVLYLNAPSLVDRNRLMLQWLKDAKVPDECISRYEGKDAAHYNSVEDIVNAAIADGFPEFKIFLNPSDQTVVNYTKRGNIALYWSNRSWLRYVAEQNPNHAYLYLPDDTRMLKPFSEFEKVVEKAPCFDILQFYNLDAQHDKKHLDFYGKMLTPTTCEFDSRFIYGAPHTGAHCSAYSPEGARKMLEYLSKNMIVWLEQINWFPTQKCSYGGIWRLLSLKVEESTKDPWVHRVPMESYRQVQNTEHQ